MDFDLIYKQYFRDVFLYLRSLSANEEIAEEIAQETFAKALKAIDSYDGQKDIRAWLFTIAKNTYFTACKRQNLFSGEELSENIASPQSVFVEQMMDEECAFQIHSFLHNMKEPYKEVFTLRVFGELSFAQIASIFKKTESWARVTYHRARLKIQERMD